MINIFFYIITNIFCFHIQFFIKKNITKPVKEKKTTKIFIQYFLKLIFLLKNIV